MGRFILNIRHTDLPENKKKITGITQERKEMSNAVKEYEDFFFISFLVHLFFLPDSPGKINLILTVIHSDEEIEKKTILKIHHVIRHYRIIIGI